MIEVFCDMNTISDLQAQADDVRGGEKWREREKGVRGKGGERVFDKGGSFGENNQLKDLEIHTVPRS